jgi:hypothetical protein
MTTLPANTAKSQNLTDAIESIKAVRKYQLDRRIYGSRRVCQYFDDVEGDWLNQFDEDVTGQPEE